MRSEPIIGILKILLTVSSVILFGGCATSREYAMPFSDAEAALFDSLNLEKGRVIAGSVAQARAEYELADSMSMKLYAVDLHEYRPDELLSFTVRHEYNIMAVGREAIRFTITSESFDRTKITVDYSDAFVAFVIPILPIPVYNPGPRRERSIHRLIWEERQNQTEHSTE